MMEVLTPLLSYVWEGGLTALRIVASLLFVLVIYTVGGCIVIAVWKILGGLVSLFFHGLKTSWREA